MLSEQEKEAVRINKYYQDELKWKIGDLNQELNTDATVIESKKFIKAVRKFQKANSLKVDGIVGPKTYEKILQKKKSELQKVIESIARPTVYIESGGDYAAMNKDGEFKGHFGESHRAYQRIHIGLSLGAYQFTQDSGSLGEYLQRCCKHNKTKFISIIGPTWSSLLNTVTREGPSGFSTNESRGPRVEPIPVNYKDRRTCRDLWEQPWTTKLERLCNVPEFRMLQDRVAVEMYLEPVLEFIKAIGFTTEKAVAATFSASIHRGSNGARDFISGRAEGLSTPVTDETVLNRMAAVDNRYNSFLNSSKLSWNEWKGWEFWNGNKLAKETS